MPHPAKKSTTTKAVKRASRVRQRKKEQNEFEKLQYLQSQLDKNGQPIDILNTDEKLLNNEQKFISRLIKRLIQIDLRSIAIFIQDNYNEEDIIEMVEYYYLNTENKTWSDTFFKITYKCLGILNLNHFLSKQIFEYAIDIIENVESTDKPLMTEQLLNDTIDECAKGLPEELDFEELINNSLLVYSQNSQYCILNGGALVGGEFVSDNFMRWLSAVGAFITFITFLVWCINNAPDSTRGRSSSRCKRCKCAIRRK
jgi:hypothetical protein